MYPARAGRVSALEAPVHPLELRIVAEPLEQRVAVNVVPQQRPDDLVTLDRSPKQGQGRIALSQGGTMLPSGSRAGSPVRLVKTATATFRGSARGSRRHQSLAQASATSRMPSPSATRPMELKERRGTGLRVPGGVAADKSTGLAIGGRPITFTRLVNHGA